MVHKDGAVNVEMQKLFGLCLIAYQTGTMPNEGGILDQSHEFIDIFLQFVIDWKMQEMGFYIEAIGGLFGKSKS